MKTKEEISMNFGKGGIQYPIVIPKGTRCKECPDYSTRGEGEMKFWVDDLSFLDKKSIVYHDAYYYGIVLDANQVED